MKFNVTKLSHQQIETASSVSIYHQFD